MVAFVVGGVVVVEEVVVVVRYAFAKQRIIAAEDTAIESVGEDKDFVAGKKQMDSLRARVFLQHQLQTLRRWFFHL